MCCLVGVMSSNMLQKHKECLANMLYLDTWRGRDSTGVAALRWNGDTGILKATVPGYEFTEGPKLFDHLKLNDFLWIGHNRFGTIGKNCKTNAHPFSADNDEGECLVVGAHNGTLKNKHVLTDHASYGTDSEALYNEIANIGLEKTIEKVEGAWALTYFDHMEDEFRIIRNKERPLFYAWAEDKKTLFWASEMWMIRVSTSRADIKLFEDKVFEITVDTLYSFPRPTKINEEITVERKGGIVGKQTPAFFHGQTTGTTGGHGHQASPHQASTQTPRSQLPPVVRQTPVVQQREGTRLTIVGSPSSSSSQSGTTTTNAGGRPTLTSVSRSNTAPDIKGSDEGRKYKGYNGIFLTKAEILDDLDAGCAWCELQMIDLNDKFAWMAPGKPVCHKCLTGEHDETDTEVFLASASIH